MSFSNLKLAWAYGVISLSAYAYADANPNPNQSIWSPTQYDSSAAAKWDAALNRARTVTSQMTLEELNNVTYGVSSACSGLTGSVPRLGWDGLCMNDAGEGVRGTDLVNAYAEGVSIGASWNVELAYDRGRYMGAEFRKKGVKVALGPVIEPIGRTALNGRNMEGFGADPSHAGKLAAASVRGLQKSVMACVKHFTGYEQEHDRQPNPINPVSVSSNINDKDMHELYLWGFQDTVAAGAASVMCSYNRVNGTYACENNATINGLLKGELGFPGFVVSDWNGQHSGIPSAAGGLDIAMPDSSYWDKGQLVAAVNNGTLSKERLQDMATRQIAASFYTFNDTKSSPPNGHGLVTDYIAPHRLVEARDPASKPNRLQQAVEGHVLVKNIKNALPLRKPKVLSLFGYDGHAQLINNPGTGPSTLWSLAMQGVDMSMAQIIKSISSGVGAITQSATGGTYFTGGGSGPGTPAYISDPFSAISARAYDEDTYLWWDFKSNNPNVSAVSDACLVFINDMATEGVDRSGLADPASDTLVSNVADKCANTIVVIHNVYTRVVDAFYDHPNVTAIVYGHLPGQDSGRALVKLLWGDVSPSGKLPYTVAKNASDYGQLLHGSNTPKGNVQSDFSDPSLFDYRYFQANDITPRFPFGFGLTYTNFTYGDVTVSSGDNYQKAPQSPPNPDKRIPGGIKSLFDMLATIKTNVTNSGSFDAAEVLQVYIQLPNEKIHVLRGFGKEYIPQGSTKEFAIELTRRDLSSWDVTSQQWLLPKGTTKVLVGASSEDIRGTATLTR